MQTDPLAECPGCGLKLPDRHLALPDRFNASGECLEVYYELTCYTLAKGDSAFIHQYVVHTYEAQHAGGKTRPITVAFGLIGLYLALEKGYSGRQVQLAHMKIGQRKRDWSRLDPPEHPAELTVLDVFRANTDAEKDDMIMRWAGVVWRSWEPQHECVREITENVLFGEGK